MNAISVSTIGFTKTTAAQFFTRLTNASVKKIIDVRLHNTSQLAGFAKAEDLSYFLKTIGKIEYQHLPILAPSDEMLRAYKKNKGSWEEYAKSFLGLMKQRKIEEILDPKVLEGACLLCSEATAHHCHRRLVCEYLNEKWHNQLSVKHL